MNKYSHANNGVKCERINGKPKAFLTHDERGMSKWQMWENVNMHIQKDKCFLNGNRGRGNVFWGANENETKKKVHEIQEKNACRHFSTCDSMEIVSLG